jgi:two-component system sensor histidine kinase YesM
MQLGLLMRKSLEAGGGRTSLGEEINYLASYLEIQKFRFSDRLRYRLVFAEATLRCRIDRLLLQPIVENAVIHGLESKPEGGMIVVEAETSDGTLRITVTDNGVGMTEEKLAALVSRLEEEEDESSRIGLRNVHQRIVLSHGKGWGLSICSRLGGGTRITIEMPAEEDGDDVSLADRG